MKMIVMHKLRELVSALLCVAALWLGTACGTAVVQPGAGTPNDRLKIVVAFYPFEFIAQRIAGPYATVASLTQPGAEPHDLELTPKQVGSVIDADLVLYEKSFQAAVDEAVSQSGRANALDTVSVVPLRDLGTHAEAGDAAADQRFLDPHVWLDPDNMATISTAVAHRLSAIDPDHGAEYAENAAALTSDLRKLDSRYRSGLTSCQRDHFVTQHEAFGYLAKGYHLTQIGVGGLSPDSEPSPARIAAVQREAKRYHVTTIFYETLVSPAVAHAVAGDLGLSTDVLDPVEGITAQSRGQDYLAVMSANLTALRAANGCR